MDILRNNFFLIILLGTLASAHAMDNHPSGSGAEHGMHPPPTKRRRLNQITLQTLPIMLKRYILSKLEIEESIGIDLTCHSLRTARLQIAPRFIVTNKTLSSNELMVKIVPALLDRKKMSYLGLSKTKINATDLATILRLSATIKCPLEGLSLKDCRYSAAAFSILTSKGIILPNLKKLYLENTGATSKQVAAALAVFPNLQELNLWSCVNAAAAFDSLESNSLPHLTTLSLDGTEATSQQVSAILGTCTNLKSLELANCPGAAKVFIDQKPESLPKLLTLKLFGSEATSEQVSAILAACTNLEELILDDCDGSSDAFNGLEPGSLPHLKKLELDCSGTPATPEQITTILAACTGLQELGAIGSLNPAEVFEGFEPGSLPALTALDLSGTNITKEQVIAILAACPKLQKLNVEYCSGSLIEALISLPEGSYPNLRELLLAGTELTPTQLDTIRHILPKCEVSG